MRFRFIPLVFTAVPIGAQAYDIEAYCQQVGAVAGASYQIEATCREQEKTAKRNIYRMSVPARIANYCQKVGGVAGGSYQIMETCIQQELQAKDDLD